MQEARLYQAFYTRSAPITEYMISKLELAPGDNILEPCGGDGVFINPILKQDNNANIHVFELNPAAVSLLRKKFRRYPNVRIRQCDTILYDHTSGGRQLYHKIIANPPYGAWQDKNKRVLLKKLYPGHYTKESYGLFLSRSINLLADGGILSFIIPDTYLNLHRHKALRHQILTQTRIRELALFPSSFFPGVNFGYAGLSVITLQKSNSQKECTANKFRIISDYSAPHQLISPGNADLNIQTIKQENILANPDHAFFISEDKRVLTVLGNTVSRIADIADCVTGFYSGNDKKYLHVSSHDIRNGKQYRLVDVESICPSFAASPDILNGLEGEKHFLPIVKGGNTKYLKPDAWYMNWSKEAVRHYQKDKKARFQNRSYYFRYGIGIPMVSSSSITASLIEHKLFDQSIVGVFPRDKQYTYYLLAFFNSPTCNKLIRTINPSANNPANYIKKLPFIPPDSEQKSIIDQLVGSILSAIKNTGTFHEALDTRLHDIIRSIYGF